VRATRNPLATVTKDAGGYEDVCEGTLTIVVALTLGMATGVAGFIPFLIAQRLSQHKRAAFREYAIPIGLCCMVASLVFLLVALLVAARLAPEVFPFFGIALAATFMVASGALAIRSIRRGRR
jgi:uncharacterized membrane protein